MLKHLRKKANGKGSTLLWATFICHFTLLFCSPRLSASNTLSTVDVMSDPKNLIWKNNLGEEKELLFGKQELLNFKSLTVKNQKAKLQLDQIKMVLDEASEIEKIERGIKVNKGRVVLVFEPAVSQLFFIHTEVAETLFKGSIIELSYDPKKVRMRTHVIDGEAIVRGFNRDEEEKILSGFSGGFQGAWELEGPAFDILLKGRKSARGDLIPIKKIDVLIKEELTQFTQVKNYTPPKKIIPKPKPGEICKNPFAKLNECVWRCQTANGTEADCKNAQCVRYRCGADGLWIEPIVVGNKQCQQPNHKAPCP